MAQQTGGPGEVHVLVFGEGEGKANPNEIRITKAVLSPCHTNLLLPVMLASTMQTCGSPAVYKLSVLLFCWYGSSLCPEVNTVCMTGNSQKIDCHGQCKATHGSAEGIGTYSCHFCTLRTLSEPATPGLDHVKFMRKGGSCRSKQAGGH